MARFTERRQALLAGTTVVAALVLAMPAVAQTTAPAAAPAPTSAPITAPANATTADRPVAAYSDNLTPQWGNIRGFWGDNTPYWGNIRGFWGDTGPYSDDLTPFWGNIRGFNDTGADTALPAQLGQHPRVRRRDRRVVGQHPRLLGQHPRLRGSAAGLYAAGRHARRHEGPVAGDLGCGRPGADRQVLFRRLRRPAVRQVRHRPVPTRPRWRDWTRARASISSWTGGTA